jgi:hypothetical protein
MQKKGQGLSMNVIIITALALLVLVILMTIFMGRMNSGSRDIKTCESNGGRCFTDDCPKDEGWSRNPLSGVKCLNTDGTEREGEVCCIHVS